MKRFIGASLIVGITLIGIFSYATKPLTPPTEAILTKPYSQQAILAMLNKERAKVGVKPLQLDDRLNDSATEKAQDMVANNYYNHSNPVTGKHGYDYVRERLSICTYVSENLVLGADKLAYNPVSAWMNSVAHKDAQLNTRYELVGFASTQAKDGKIYYVAHFCDLY
jgi:uncharacterized protein YkwD